MSINSSRFRSWKLFWNAAKGSGPDIWVSLQVLAGITLVLAIIFFFAEHNAQPEEYGFWQSILWAFSRYIGDPGKFAQVAPVTITGRIIAMCIGILGILIFAIPAGVIGSRFRKAIDDDKRSTQLDKYSITMHKLFRREAQTLSKTLINGSRKRLNMVPRFISITDFQAKTGLSSNDIIETVAHCPDFRLINLAHCKGLLNPKQDRLAVMLAPINQEYGCLLDRGSDVTIVAPCAERQFGTGHLAFYLAAMGGFNLVSRELTPTIGEDFNFFSMIQNQLNRITDSNVKKDVSSQALHFMDDLKQLKRKSEEKGNRHWFIMINATGSSTIWQMNFMRYVVDNEKRIPSRINDATASSVMTEDEAIFQSIFDDSRVAIEQYKLMAGQSQETNIKIEMDNMDFMYGMGLSNVLCRIGCGIDCSAFIIRVSYDLLMFDEHHLLIVKELADSIKKHIESDKSIPDEAMLCYLKLGEGFADKFGENIVFESSPASLKKKIEKWRNEAMEKYGQLNLKWEKTES